MRKKKSFYYKVITFGCQMNKSDSERIEGLLLDMGMKEAGDCEAADLIVLNTCSVRQTAEDRVYGLVRNFVRLKRKKPHLLIGVTGCVAGRDKDGAIRKKMQGNPPSNSPLKKGGEVGSGIDFFFPISDLPRLPEMIFERWARSAKRETLSLPKGSRRHTIGSLAPYSYPQKKIDYLGVQPKAKEWWRGWVVIQTGCSNYCTYCVVPYARGHEKNRSVAAILKEVQEMVKGGAREIQLLGQTVNSWQAPDPQNFSKDNPFTVGSETPYSFAALLWEINQIPGVNRVGFASAHPMYMNDAAIKALKLPKMMNYLHLPVQSGNNEVLRRMHRKYTREDYLKVIHRVRKARPDIALATDIIVGFPGETKKQFSNTASLYKKCDFDMSYNSMYSPRTGTAAYKVFKDDISREEKRRRWLVLQKLMEKNALRKNKKYLGRTVEVLVDGCNMSLIRANKGISGKCWGFSREYKKVSFLGSKKLVGQVVNVKIKQAKEWEMEGEMIN